MKHVSFCGSRLRALVVITAFAAAALAFAAPALAVSEPAVPPAGTFKHGTTDNWASSARVNGMFTPGTGIFGAAAPADCGRVPPNGTDVEGFVCSVHDTDPQDNGLVEVVVTLDTSMLLPDSPTPQVAVAVFKCLDPKEPMIQVDNATCPDQVAFRDQSLNPDIPQLRVTFQAIGDAGEPADATIFYEVRVIPIDVPEPTNYDACAGYIDNGADPCPNNPALNQQPPDEQNVVPASEFLKCSPGDTGNRRFTGSGAIEDSPGNKTDQVSISVRQRSDKPTMPQGQINHRFFPTKRKFHSKKFACASFHDNTPEKTVEVKGIGWTKVDGQKPVKVCFSARFQDSPTDTNQKGTGDNFDITTVPFFRNDPSKTSDDTCGRLGTPAEMHGGTITKGNFRYRINDRGDDCEYNEYDHDNTYAKDSDYDWSYGG